MKKREFTIGLSVFNEEANIEELLHSIKKSVLRNFKLIQILIVSDGCTDKTVSKIKAFKGLPLKLIDGKTNKGRTARINQIIKSCSTDILVLLDGDENLSDIHSLEKLLNGFDDKRVALVGGNPYTVYQKSFLSSCQVATREIYTNIRYRIKHGNNVFGCMGGFYAINLRLLPKIQIPLDVYATDSYVYMSCIKAGHKFVNIKNAKIDHFMPTTVSAHIQRNSRHSKSRDELKKYFGELVTREFKINPFLYSAEVLRQFFKKPIQIGFIAFLNLYSRFI